MLSLVVYFVLAHAHAAAPASCGETLTLKTETCGLEPAKAAVVVTACPETSSVLSVSGVPAPIQLVDPELCRALKKGHAKAAEFSDYGHGPAGVQ